MVKTLLFVRVQVGLGAAHPKQIAMQNDFAVTKRFAVITNEPFKSEWEQSVYSPIHKPVCIARLRIQKMRQSSGWLNVLSPHHRIPEHHDVRYRQLLKSTLIQPIVFTQGIWNPVIWPDFKPFQILPYKRRRHDRTNQQDKDYEQLPTA